MDASDTQGLPAPDHGPGDTAFVRRLRALVAPLRVRPDTDVRRRHIAAASAAARGVLQAPGRARTARIRTRVLRGALRPVLAGGLTVSLVAGLVAAVTVGIPATMFSRDGEERVEILMASGFTPSPVSFERSEDHVILTVDADRAEALADELRELLESEPTVLSVRTDRTAFTVPASVAARLELVDIEAVADTPVSTLSASVTQRPVPSWGLDRIDAVDEPLDGSYRFVSTGAGVRVYVIDTGVRSDHADLAGRVVPGWSAIEDGRGSEDCNGHGTHVAGTVAGSSFGVAKGATIVAVRVLDCNGSGFASSVVSGLSWVIANHPGGPGVINLSIGGPGNSAVDRAVADATDRGLVVIAAAGNDAGDACDTSPARAASAVTTGATTSSDTRAEYSNFGICVDLFAPGSGITSAWHTSSGASATLSGTSMAAPHVAGIAARLLQAEPGAGPGRISSLLTGSASSGSVDGTNGSPNLLANLVDFDEEVDCAQLVEDGEELPEECLAERCERLEGEGAELPVECSDEDEDEAEDEEREGDGRPDTFPGRSGFVPPGFGGPNPGLERAPGLEGRTPPGRVDGAPAPVREVSRVNGLSIARDGVALRAEWRAAGQADAFVVECTALPSGPTWRTDVTLRLAADNVVRAGDRISAELSAQVDGLDRCRIAAELDGVLGVRSSAAKVPDAADDAASDDGDSAGSGPEPGSDAGGPVTPDPSSPADPSERAPDGGTLAPEPPGQARRNAGPSNDGTPGAGRRPPIGGRR